MPRASNSIPRSLAAALGLVFLASCGAPTSDHYDPSLEVSPGRSFELSLGQSVELFIRGSGDWSYPQICTVTPRTGVLNITEPCALHAAGIGAARVTINEGDTYVDVEVTPPIPHAAVSPSTLASIAMIADTSIFASAVDNAGSVLYHINPISGTLTVVRHAGGFAPGAVLAPDDGSVLYHAGLVYGTVTLFDPATHLPIDSILGIPGLVIAATLHEPSARLYVSTRDSFSTEFRIYAIDTDARAVLGHMTTPNPAIHLTASPQGDRVFAVLSSNLTTMIAIAAAPLQIVDTIAVGPIGAMTVAADGARLYGAVDGEGLIDCSTSPPYACTLGNDGYLAANSVLISPDGETVYSAGGIGIAVYQRTPLRLRRLIIGGGSIERLDTYPSAGYIAMATASGILMFPWSP